MCARFAFPQSLGDLPDLHNISKIIESSLVKASASCFQTLDAAHLVPRTCVSQELQSTPWLYPTHYGLFFLSWTLSIRLEAWKTLLVKTGAKKAMNMSASPMSALTKSSASFSNRLTFFLFSLFPLMQKFCVSLDIPCKSQLHLSFGFSDTVNFLVYLLDWKHFYKSCILSLLGSFKERCASWLVFW